jgi:hypothetical protein
MAPFKSLYDYEPPRLKDFALADITVPAVKNHLGENQKTNHIMKENLVNT